MSQIQILQHFTYLELAHKIIVVIIIIIIIITIIIKIIIKRRWKLIKSNNSYHKNKNIR